MKRERRALRFLTMMGMELSWRYAWANFLTTSILHRFFPFPEAIVTFALAAVVTLLSRGRGWRIITILMTQVFGFILASLRMVYLFNSWYHPMLSEASFTEFFKTPTGSLEWFHLILLLFLVLIFWVGGVTFVKRPKVYAAFCSRFDLGIAAFALLFLTKFIALYKGGVRIDDPLSQLFFFPFFIFSLLGIGSARGGATSPKNFLPGYQGIGVILSFTGVVLLFGVSLVLFFLPYLTLAAETGYGVMKTAAKPFGPVLVSILRFIFMGRSVRPEPSSGAAEEGIGELITPGESSWWMELLEKTFTWVFGGLLGFTVLVGSCIALFFLFRWLLSKTPSSRGGQTPWSLISLWLERVRIFLVSLRTWIIRRRKGYRAAIQLFKALRIWGRRSGLPHILSETPTEYGLRLKHRFPSLGREIELIIEAFNQEVYAETTLSETQLSQVRFALRRMRSPIHWPSRLRSWFLRPQPAAI
ncbi:MAG: DUF4129 domain-containing protein [Thermodesulfobacteriota bacterium]